MTFQRARQPEQKALRRAAILEAAADLFDETRYDDVSLQQIAKRAGVGKASLYTYFRTKEEIFLQLYRADIEAWLTEMQGRLSTTPVGAPRVLAEQLAAAVLACPRACRLGVLLASVLERNVPVPVLLEFKFGVLAISAKFMVSLARVLPGVQPPELMGFMVDHFALVGGLWPMAHPPPEVEAALEGVDELEPLRVQMKPALERSLRLMLVGLLAEAAPLKPA